MSSHASNLNIILVSHICCYTVTAAYLRYIFYDPQQILKQKLIIRMLIMHILQKKNSLVSSACLVKFKSLQISFLVKSRISA